MKKNLPALLLLCTAAGLLLPASVRSVTLGMIRQTGYFDFVKGRLNGLSLDDEGGILLNRSFGSIRGVDEMLVWSSCRDAAGNLFFGTGNNGRVYRLAAGATNAVLFFDSGGPAVTALACDAAGNLYAAVSPRGTIFRITPAGSPSVHSLLPSRTIWALSFDSKGRLIAACGDPGAVYRIGSDGKSADLIRTAESHFIALHLDASDRITAAGASTGLVYRLLPDNSLSVLFDTRGQEITAMTVDKAGNLWVAAGTDPSDRFQQIPGGPEQRETERPNQPPARPSGIVYKVAPNGGYEKLIELQDQSFLSIIADRDDTVYIGSARNGELYAVRSDEQALRIGQLGSGSILCLLAAPDGRIMAGTGNTGSVFIASPAFRPDGIYLSDVFDLRFPARPGQISWEAESPDGTAVLVQTRSGNSGIPDETWSPWSAGSTTSPSAMSHPMARFLQYRLTLTTKNSSLTPRVTDLRLTWSTINMRPEILRFEVEPLPGREEARKPPAKAKPAIEPGERRLIWECRDPNEDEMIYSLSFRPKGGALSIDILPETKDSFLVFDTKRIPDGWYTFRLIASDRPSNSAETALAREAESSLVLVDNSPPAIRDIKTTRTESGWSLQGLAEDEWSEIRSVEYSFEGQDWLGAEPGDGAFDSLREQFSITLKKAEKPGFIMIRSTDLHGNTRTVSAGF